jgi:hypothetical protein
MRKEKQLDSNFPLSLSLSLSLCLSLSISISLSLSLSLSPLSLSFSFPFFLFLSHSFTHTNYLSLPFSITLPFLSLTLSLPCTLSHQLVSIFYLVEYKSVFRCWTIFFSHSTTWEAWVMNLRPSVMFIKSLRMYHWKVAK